VPELSDRAQRSGPVCGQLGRDGPSRPEGQWRALGRGRGAEQQQARSEETGEPCAPTSDLG